MPSLISIVQHSKDRKQPRGPIIHVVAVALVVGFGLLQGFIADQSGIKTPYLLFFPAIMMSAWFGGWRAGVTASLLSVIAAAYFFMEPVHQLLPMTAPQVWSNSIFVLEGLFISVLGEARLQSSHRLLSERNSLEERVVQRTQEMIVANQTLAAQIAEREQAQIALSESESKFRSVVETANDAIVMCDSAGIIVFWNRGAQEMFGYSAEEVLHTPVGRISEMMLV